jgi:hypothetical protein
VQSNVFTATQSRLERNRANQPARGASAQRHQQQNHQPSSAILAHNRKRALENLRLHLEELGHSPEEIKRQLSIEHERLATGKTRSISNSDSHQPHPDSHTNAARKQHELDTVGRALDLDSSSAREGDAFDSEKQAHAKAEQAHAKLEEIKERERRREEAKRQKAEKCAVFETLSLLSLRCNIVVFHYLSFFWLVCYVQNETEATAAGARGRASTGERVQPAHQQSC